MTTTTTDMLSELRWRGLLHQSTDEDALREHLSSPCHIYAGFDPTADSLTIGNLVPIMLLRHAQLAGHTPVVLMGGGTGLIGDPSGKSDERQLMTRETVRSNIEAQRPIFASILDFESSNAPIILDNANWLEELSYIEALRDIGKHFSVNMMMQKDSVRDRLANREQGISYTEFSYMILQSYDFLHLAQHESVSVQCGGSDQWGNIVSGIDLTRRALGREVHGYTAPLVTKADGGKFGKTEAGAVWLTEERTSAYAYYQFWLNADDADCERFLKTFTLLPETEIAAVLTYHGEQPHLRHAQRTLAREATNLLHGGSGLARAEAATEALFAGDIASLDAPTLEEAFGAAPSSEHSLADLRNGMSLVELLPTTSLASSKREAREFVGNGAISINGARVSEDRALSPDDLLHGSSIVLKRGKKKWHITRWKA
ncbi:MAG: tyrosine--tRNA ligase [Planctomycetota bacterium]|jgi:tyrosyl-tRNA synthetase